MTQRDNYNTTPSTIVIKWIGENQFFIVRTVLLFLRQNGFKFFIANAIKHDINSLYIHHHESITLCTGEVFYAVHIKNINNVIHTQFTQVEKARRRKEKKMWCLKIRKKPVLHEIDKFLIVFFFAGEKRDISWKCLKATRLVCCRLTELGSISRFFVKNLFHLI